MKAILDQEMPVRGRRLGWLYVLIGIIVLLVAGYFFTKKGIVQPEVQPIYAQEVPAAAHERLSGDGGGTVVAESGQERARMSEMGVSEKGQREQMGNGLPEDGKEDEGGAVVVISDLSAKLGRQEAVSRMVANDGVISDRAVEEAVIGSESAHQLVTHVAALRTHKVNFVMESPLKDEIQSFGLSKRNSFKLNGQVQAGLVSFPGHPFSGLEMGIGAIIEKEDSPWSLQVDLGYGRVVHDASAFGLTSYESELRNSAGGIYVGTKGDLNEIAFGDQGLIDPARVDIVYDAINAWDRIYGRMTVSRHIHGGLRLGVGMALQYVSDVAHNSVLYYEDTDEAGIIEKQYLELEDKSLNQLGWIRAYIPSALLEIEYRMDPNWSIVGRYEQDLAGIVKSTKSSLPHYESDSRLGVGVKWRFN